MIRMKSSKKPEEARYDRSRPKTKQTRTTKHCAMISRKLEDVAMTGTVSNVDKMIKTATTRQ
jgi:hypothetical protein